MLAFSESLWDVQKARKNFLLSRFRRMLFRSSFRHSVGRICCLFVSFLHRTSFCSGLQHHPTTERSVQQIFDQAWLISGFLLPFFPSALLLPPPKSACTMHLSINPLLNEFPVRTFLVLNRESLFFFLGGGIKMAPLICKSRYALWYGHLLVVSGQAP